VTGNINPMKHHHLPEELSYQNYHKNLNLSHEVLSVAEISKGHLENQGIRIFLSSHRTLNHNSLFEEGMRNL
jgi:hypothetical protein